MSYGRTYEVSTEKRTYVTEEEEREFPIFTDMRVLFMQAESLQEYNLEVDRVLSIWAQYRVYKVLADDRVCDVVEVHDDREMTILPEDRSYDVSEEERVMEVLPA